MAVQSRDIYISRIQENNPTSTICHVVRSVTLVASAAIEVSSPETAKDLKNVSALIGFVPSLIDSTKPIAVLKSTAFDKNQPGKFTRDVLTVVNGLWSIASIVNKVFSIVKNTPLFSIPALSVVFGGFSIAQSSLEIYYSVKEIIALGGKLSQSMGQTEILHDDEINKELEAYNQLETGDAQQLLTQQWKLYDTSTHNPIYVKKEMIKKSLNVALNVISIAATIIGIAILFATPVGIAALTTALIITSCAMATIGVAMYILKISSPTLKQPTLEGLIAT